MSVQDLTPMLTQEAREGVWIATEMRVDPVLCAMSDEEWCRKFRAAIAGRETNEFSIYISFTDPTVPR